MKKIIRSSFYLILLLLLLYVVSGCTKAGRESRAIAKADSDFKAGRYESAEIRYREALRLGGSGASKGEVLSKLGRVYFAQGRWSTAEFFLKQGLIRNTNDVPSMALLNESLFLMGSVSEAYSESAALLKMKPGHPEAMVLLADSALMNIAKITNALSILDSQPNHAKQTAAYLTAHGTLLLRSTNFDGAEIDFKAALEQDRNFYRAHLGMAFLHGLRNVPDKAKAEARDAITALPERSGAISACLTILSRLGEKKKAVDVASEIVKKHPDFVPPYLFLASVAFEDGIGLEGGSALKKARFEDSLSFFKKAQANDPQNLGITVMCGDVYLAMNDGTNALSCFEAVARSQTNPPPALLVKMANAQLVKSDLTSAKALFRQALDANTNYVYPEAALTLSALVFKQRDARTAKELTPRLIQLTNQQPMLQGYVGLADTYLTQEDTNSAIQVMQAAQKRFPEAPEVPSYLGKLYNLLGQKAEARNALERALGLATNNITLLYALIMHDLGNGRYEDASNLISNSIKDRPDVAPLHYIRGVVFQEGAKMSGGSSGAAQKEKIDGAIASFREAIKLDPTYSAAYYSLAQVYADAQRHQEALRELENLPGQTNSPSAHLLAAGIHQELKNYPEAAAEYEKILAMNQPSGITLMALNNLACLYTDHTTNKWDRAYELAERARKMAPRTNSIAETFGWAAFRKGEYSQALTLLKEATEDSELAAKPGVMYHLAMAHYMAGDEEIAREKFNQALYSAEVKTNAVSTGSSTKEDSDSTPDWVQDAKIKLKNLELNKSSADSELEKAVTNQLAAVPGDPVLLRRMGMVQEWRGKYDEALKSYEAALKFNPKHTGTRLQIALLYAGPMNQLGGGLGLAKKALSDAPNDPAAARVVGKLAYRFGDYRTAVNMLRESAPSFPDDDSLSYDLGAALYCDGRGDDAEQVMRKLAGSGAAGGQVADAKQFLLFTSAAKEPGKQPEVVKAAIDAMTKTTNNMPAKMLVAGDYEARKDYTNAVKSYIGILRDYPLFIPASRNLGLLYFNNQDRVKAYERLKEKTVRERYSEDAVFCRALGILACEQRVYSQAEQLLKSNPEVRPDDSEGLFCLGKAQFNNGNKEEGKQNLKRAGDLDADLRKKAQKMLEDSK